MTVAQPEREQERADHEEQVDEHVGLGRQEPLAEARDDEDEQEWRPECPGGHVPVEAARRSRRRRADDEEPELEVERDDVDAAHRVKGRRVEDRDDRRVRRAGARREDLRVEAAEEVDRLRLRHPERPGVERLQALQPRRAEERLEQEPGSAMPAAVTSNERR